MASLPENEQRKKIKQLRLRWHPDKNPVLGEFAAEVTKIINESVEQLKKSKEETEHAAADDGGAEQTRQSSENHAGTEEQGTDSAAVHKESAGGGDKTVAGVLTVRNE